MRGDAQYMMSRIYCKGHKLILTVLCGSIDASVCVCGLPLIRVAGYQAVEQYGGV